MDPTGEHVTAGAIAMGYAVAALFFLRFWWATRDRLFVFFALSFAVLAVNRVVVVILYPEPGPRPEQTYWIRLAAFAFILVGILDKNRWRR